MGENLPKLNDDSGISINIKWLVQIVILVGSAVLLYTHLEGRIAETENEIQGLRYNQNTYVFPDIRILEDEILDYKLERERVRKDLKRINEILEIQRGHFEHGAEVMVEFREELAQVDKIATGVADEISKVGDTIVDAFLRGKAGALDFKNILRELIISIQKTIIQTLILDEVNKFVKGAIKGIFNPASVTSHPSMAGVDIGGSHASGGTIQPNKPSLVGERGPELFVPNTAGTIKNNADTKQMVGSGGGINVTQNLNFAVGVTTTVRAEVMNMLSTFGGIKPL